MIIIRYVEHDGVERAIELTAGQSLMEGAVANGVRGIDAECGGSCACGTCHVYIEESWVGTVGMATGLEAELLEFSARRQPNSRLACQVAITESLNGLVVHLPETQKG